MNVEELLRNNIRAIPDYPKKGIVFRDITPLLKNKEAFHACIDQIANHFKKEHIDFIVGVEARGFIIGAALAAKMGLGFVPVRKKGKLPHHRIGRKYALEYGEEEMEIHKDAVDAGDKVLVVDDLLATGGTAEATVDLVESLGGKIVGVAFVIELTALKGREKLRGQNVLSLVKY